MEVNRSDFKEGSVPLTIPSNKFSSFSPTTGKGKEEYKRAQVSLPQANQRDSKELINKALTETIQTPNLILRNLLQL